MIRHIAARTDRSPSLVSLAGALGRRTMRAAWRLLPRRPYSLRAHLFAIVLLAVLPGLAVALFSTANAMMQADAARQSRLSETARALASAVDQELDSAIATLTALATRSGLEAGGEPAAFALRAGFAAQAAEAPITLHRRDGEAVLTQPASAAAGRLDADPSFQALLELAMSQRRAQVSDVFISPASHLPVTAIVVPVLQGATALGALDLQITADRMTATLRRQTRYAGGIAVLVDRQSRVIAASRDVARLVGAPYSQPPSPAEPGWLGTRPATGTTRALPLRAPGWQLLYTEFSPPQPALGFALGQSAVAGLTAAVAGLLLVAAFGERLTRPLRALTDLASLAASGGDRPTTPLPASTVAEFEALRHGMSRAEAVLRRRGAAERMALREARTGHELLVSVVNGTAESIHVKDLELRYVLVNRAALLAGDVPRAEWQVLGRGTADLFPPIVARRIEAADRTVLATGQMVSFEQDYIVEPAPGMPDDPEHGAIRWLAMTITPWQDAEGRIVGVVSVSRDVTRKRLADARIRAMQADLLRATRLSAMGAMASGLAHELNQPLAAATNYLNAGGRLLDRGVLGDEQAFRAARGAVTEAAQQMLRAGLIVRRLRDFVERGEVEMQPQDTADLLREACDLARNDGINAGIALREEVADGGHIVLVDRTQIQQVLLNLIRNAAEAITTSGLDRPGEIVVAAHVSAQGSMCIDVSDNGPGLAPGIAERLFEPFVSSKPTGMGIGLAICRTIIEGHGGRLVAQPIADADPATSAPAGMRFRITLPALTPAGEPA